MPTSKKHVTLVANTNNAVVVDGVGALVVLNHDTGEEIYCLVGATAATVKGDENMSVLPGRARKIGNAEHDTHTTVNLISLGGGNASVEIVDFNEVEGIVG